MKRREIKGGKEAENEDGIKCGGRGAGGREREGERVEDGEEVGDRGGLDLFSLYKSVNQLEQEIIWR